jgi:dipeptidyl aminopeptidase/acylaminoacyl peptidase
MNKIFLFIGIVFCLHFSVNAQENFSKELPSLSWKDVPSWKSININGVQLSPNGKWAVYVMSPGEGDSELMLVNTTKPEEIHKFPIGSTPVASFSFSENSKWLAFKEYPKEKDKKGSTKNLPEKLILLNLDTQDKTKIDKANRFSFNGKSSSHLAVSVTKDGGNSESKGSDLILIHLASGNKQNMGNVAEFEFNKPGTYLAYTIDASNKLGNGVYLNQMAAGTTQILDSDTATYKSLSWTENGDAFTLLKLKKDQKYKQELGVVLGIKNLQSPKAFVVDPSNETVNFPKGHTVSANRKPMWSDDLSKLFYGVQKLELAKKEDKSKESDKEEKDPQKELEKLLLIKSDTSIRSLADLSKAIAKADTSKTAKKPMTASDATKPDMTIWHWQDSRLQSRQQILENQDKNYSQYGMFISSFGKHVSIQDSTVREMSILPKQQFALASDKKKYELEENLSGQSHEDFYIVDLSNGSKKLLIENLYLPRFSSYPRSSPDGTKVLYGKDGHFYVVDLKTMTHKNITASVPTNFINTESDVNIINPLNQPLGWSADSKYVLLRDNWDIWQVAVASSEKPINLTQNGAKEKIRYQSRYVLDPEEKGIDLKKDQYLKIYGENTKKSGVVVLKANKTGLAPGAEVLIWEDAAIDGFTKAKLSNEFLIHKENFNSPRAYYLTDARISNLKLLANSAPETSKFSWSSGVKLVDYISDKGDTLQGALFLPANYEEGKKYPTIVYYYEKLSQTLHNYVKPGFSGTGWNANIYTSNGYAVFIPDIVYKVDDPGMSAVWCVLPAVKAAIKTGIIDENRMGLHGHSWGGYQTAFLITQTNMFKAAAAGAPLTNMISMYDLIYWNSGGGNMSIFESSQGRFKGAPWENWDSYERNSPIYFVKNVQTPLLMLHNDKDGAVDFTQGIEYYNALRRLRKPVIMVQYKGENHGLAKMENRKDYSVRMMEFFDYHLKGEKAPDWVASGIERIQINQHLEERAFEFED